MKVGDPVPQTALITKVQAGCRRDRRIAAALMYGSFTQGEGDAYADIEFWFFLEEAAWPAFELRSWLAPVAPFLALVDNEFGGQVAVFEGLIRGEFHLARHRDLSQLAEWSLGDESFDVDAMVVTDRYGSLRFHLERLRERGPGADAPRRLQRYGDRFLNWFLFGLQLLARGERARAHDILSHVQRHLAWLARIVHGAYQRHFLTPSKRLEEDLPPPVYRRYREATAGLGGSELDDAYRRAWWWGRELLAWLTKNRGTVWHAELMETLSGRVEALLGSDSAPRSGARPDDTG